MLGSKFELTRMGRMFQALVMLVYAVCTVEVEWTAGRVWTVLFMLVGGMAVFSGLFLIYAALCFFTLDGLEFMNAHGRGQGVRQVSVGHLREAGSAVCHGVGTLFADPVLSDAIYLGQGRQSGLYLPASVGCPVSAAMLRSVAVWSEALQVQRFMRFHGCALYVCLRIRVLLIWEWITAT